MDSRAKILGKYRELIDYSDKVKEEGRKSSEFDLWAKRIKSLLRKTGKDELLKEYEECIQRGRGAVWAGMGDELLIERFNAKVDCLKNLLIATKEEIEFFEEPEIKKEAKKIKSKWGLEAGVPGVGKVKYEREKE